MKEKNSVSDCQIIKLNTYNTNREVVTNFDCFDLKRVYYLYDVPSSVSRGSHAHKASSQFIIAVNGSFSIVINDGESEEIFLLSKPNEGLYIRPGIWRELINFSDGAVCLVLSPEKYDDKGCIRNYDEFVKFRKDLK